MAQVAFLGAGQMGSGMIRNLLRAGHQVTVHNRTPERATPLLAEGARLAPTPRAAAEGAEAVLSMLTDDAASRAGWTGPDGALSGMAPGALCIECSSLSQGWILALAGLCGDLGVSFLDCPVAGRPPVAQKGELAVFAGGAAEDVAAATPILQAFSKSIAHFGPAGSGIAFKLIYNALGAVQVAAVAEAMHACDAAGMDLDTCAAAFAAGATGSPHVTQHARAMAARLGPQPVAFPGASRIKDLNYAIDLAEGSGSPAHLARAARTVFGIMTEQGMDQRNDSEVIDALRARHPLPSGPEGAKR